MAQEMFRGFVVANKSISVVVVDVVQQLTQGCLLSGYPVI